MNPRHDAVARRAADRCEYCRAPETLFNFAFEVEHIVPTCVGGPDDSMNLALACHSCNRHKSIHVTGWDSESRTRVALFDPRRQAWHDHFKFVPSACTIEALTPTGRATVSRLAMNSRAQIRARRLWVQRGAFP